MTLPVSGPGGLTKLTNNGQAVSCLFSFAEEEGWKRRSSDQLQMGCHCTCSVTMSSDTAFLLRMEGSSRSHDPFLPDVDGAEHDGDHLHTSQRHVELLR